MINITNMISSFSPSNDFCEIEQLISYFENQEWEKILSTEKLPELLFIVRKNHDAYLTDSDLSSWMTWIHLKDEFEVKPTSHLILEENEFTECAKKFLLPMLFVSEKIHAAKIKSFISNESSFRNLFFSFPFSERKLQASIYYMCHSLIKEVQDILPDYDRYLKLIRLHIGTLKQLVSASQLETNISLLEFNGDIASLIISLEEIKLLCKLPIYPTDVMYGKAILLGISTLPFNSRFLAPVKLDDAKEQVCFLLPHLDILNFCAELAFPRDAMIANPILGHPSIHDITRYAEKGYRLIEIDCPWINTLTIVHDCEVKSGQKIIHDLAHWIRQSMIPKNIRDACYESTRVILSETGFQSTRDCWLIHDMDYYLCSYDLGRDTGMREISYYYSDILCQFLAGSSIDDHNTIIVNNCHAINIILHDIINHPDIWKNYFSNNDINEILKRFENTAKIVKIKQLYPNLTCKEMLFLLELSNRARNSFWLLKSCRLNISLLNLISYTKKCELLIEGKLLDEIDLEADAKGLSILLPTGKLIAIYEEDEKYVAINN